ncbi:hypothetical protein A8F94_17795 [Bacillus sp. FJAT-27225]|nr:hypothetical protein A8F94_17795 [Bacillus sp. FJAT-27225]
MTFNRNAIFPKPSRSFTILIKPYPQPKRIVANANQSEKGRGLVKTSRMASTDDIQEKYLNIPNHH